MTEVNGYCDERFIEAKEIFEQSISSGFELGCAITLEIEGEVVLDLWGGHANLEKTEKWKKDTIVNVFSTTKGMASMCLLQLVEKGLIDLDAPVSQYWPEFASNGKEVIPVRYLLCHKSGLCGVREPLDHGSFTNWELICSELAKQEPFWEPGTSHGYHALTFGHLVGELVRRVSGKTIGKYFNDEIAKPLDLDFWIGLPEDKFSRVTNIQPNIPGLLQKIMMPILSRIPRFAAPRLIRMLLDMQDPTTASGAAFNNPQMKMDPENMEANTREWRMAEIPAANGHGTARSIAKLYGALAIGGSRDGVHVLNPETIEMARQTESDGKDLVLGHIHTRFGLGFMLGTEDVSMGPNKNSMGHGGAGGSLGFADIDNKISLGFTMNQMHEGITAWKTATDVAESIYNTLNISK
jgi:CubicO group peptidase (beta-lactamase class C family)